MKNPCSPNLLRARVGLIVQLVGVPLVVVGLVCGWALSQCGSVALIAPYLRGYRLLVNPVKIDLGKQAKDHVVDLKIEVVNLTGQNVTFVGAQKNCDCVAIDEFPLLLAATESRQLKLKVALPSKPEKFERYVKFFTDYPDRQAFVVAVSAVVH